MILLPNAPESVKFFKRERMIQNTRNMIVAFTFVTAFLCIALIGCHVGSTFDGTILSNADSIKMDYIVLDQEKDFP